MWGVWYYLSCQSFREKYIFRRFACCWPPQCVITNDHFLVIRNTFRSVSKQYLVLAFCLFPPSATWFEISPVSVFKGGPVVEMHEFPRWMENCEFSWHHCLMSFMFYIIYWRRGKFPGKNSRSQLSVPLVGIFAPYLSKRALSDSIKHLLHLRI